MVQDYGPQNAYLNGARCRKNTQVQEGGSVEKGWKVGENTSVETFLVKTKALKQQTFPSNRKKKSILVWLAFTGMELISREDSIRITAGTSKPNSSSK